MILLLDSNGKGWRRGELGTIPPFLVYLEELFLASEHFCATKDPKLLLNILEILKPAEMYEYHNLSKVENDLQVLKQFNERNGDVLNYQLELITLARIWIDITKAVFSKNQGTDAGWSNAFLMQDMANQVGRLVEQYKSFLP